jgi:bla regulator protein blaR1
MANFFYSFYNSAFHSLWQATLLFAVYWLCTYFFKETINSIQKRNLLLLGLLLQMVFFIGTFLLYLFNFIPAHKDSFFNTDQFTNQNSFTTDIPAVVFYFYVAVLIFKTIKGYSNWYFFKKQLLKDSTKPNIDIRLFTKQTALQLGIKNNVEIWLSNTISVPITFGYLKPILLFPISLLSKLSTSQIEALIVHELSHVSANDYLLNWFLLCAQNLFFFNPVIVQMCKQAKLEREKNCDMAVVNLNYSPLVYAEALLQLENNKQQLFQYPLAAVTQKNQLLIRIQSFCGVKSQTISAKKIATTLLFLSLLLLSFSFFNNLILSNKEISKNKRFALPITAASINDKQKKVFYFDTKENVKTLPKKKNKLTSKTVTTNRYKKVEKDRITNEKDNILVDDNFTMPAALKQNDATKQVIIQEEQSGSRTATVTVYEVKFINGEWVIQPQLKATAKEVKAVTPKKNKTKKPHRNAANVKNLSAL